MVCWAQNNFTIDDIDACAKWILEKETPTGTYPWINQPQINNEYVEPGVSRASKVIYANIGLDNGLENTASHGQRCIFRLQFAQDHM